MTKFRSFLSALVIAGCSLGTTAGAVELNIMTGGVKGTFIQFGENIAKIGAECGLELNVQPSAGSLENVFAVRDRPVTQFGIVQSDTLEFLKTMGVEDPKLSRAANGLRIMFPLYNEEIHILARKDIAGLGDLAGKRISVGAEGSGTALTSQLVLDLAQIDPAARISDLSPQASLDALLAGEIDAMVYVVGAPAALFETDAIDPEKFHILPITDKVLSTVYTPSTIAGGTYPFQQDDVDIIAVKSVLVTYDFRARKNSYHRESCKAISDVTHLVLSRFDKLQAQGHPKWNAVDITDIPPGWEIGDCVLAGLEPSYSFTCRAPDGTVTQEGEAAKAGSSNELFLDRACKIVDCES